MRPAGPSSAAAAAVHQPRRLPPGSSCVRFTASPRLTVAAAARQQRGATAAPATTAAAPLPSPLGPAAFQLQAAGEVDRLLYPRSPLGELEHRAEAVVHTAQRLEYRLQRRAAALPAAVRRLVAGGLAGACAKTATAPLSTVQMAQMTSAGVNAVQVGPGGPACLLQTGCAGKHAAGHSCLPLHAPHRRPARRRWRPSGSGRGCGASSGAAPRRSAASCVAWARARPPGHPLPAVEAPHAISTRMRAAGATRWTCSGRCPAAALSSAATTR